MKNQYYGDSRDVAKWTVLVRLAQMHALSSIIQIAMLTPDDRTKHGSQRDDPADADPRVRQFFAKEREFFARNPRSRSVNRVKGLAESLGLFLSIEVIGEPFRHQSRGAYFRNVADRLSNLGRSTLAFLDPDVGIAAARTTEKHVTTGELEAVWEALDTGSVLVVFQFEQRQVGWRQKAINLFAEALRFSSQDITAFPYRRVIFLSALKAGFHRRVTGSLTYDSGSSHPLTSPKVGATMGDAMLDARVDRLEAALGRLVDAQAQTQADLRALAAAQKRTEEQLAALITTVKGLADAVADLKGDQLERHYREHADAYFAALLDRLHVLSVDERSSLAADARDAGRLSPEEAHDLLRTDLILRGKAPDGTDRLLVVEVSSVIDSRDVFRAARRAQLLASATGLAVTSAVAGKQSTSEAAAECATQHVWQILDGHVTEPRLPGTP